jgi:hypothetical protein
MSRSQICYLQLLTARSIFRWAGGCQLDILQPQRIHNSYELALIKITSIGPTGEK